VFGFGLSPKVGPPTASPAARGGGAAPAVRITDKDIPNFAPVAPGIWRGAAPNRSGLEKLKILGVRQIVDLRIERKGQDEEEATCRRLGFDRVRIRMGREAPTRRQVEEFLARCDRAGSAPLFIHCQHGADRTGAMVGIFRVDRQGWDYAKARAEMKKFGFKPWLHELEESVRSRVRTAGRR